MMSDDAGRMLVNVAAAPGTSQAAPDTMPEQAAVTALTGRCVALEKENAALRDERDYLRHALEVALMASAQRALPPPGPRRRAWWRFWGRDEGEG